MLDSRVFDPEWVGYMLANNMADHPVTDFQEYPSWRRLVPVVADEIAKATDQHLVAVQTVLKEEYWREIESGFKALGLKVLHVVLDADADTLHERIDADHQEPERIRPWRHRHVDAYQAALEWLRPSADFIVDTVTVDALGAAELIHAWIGAQPLAEGIPKRS